MVMPPKIAPYQIAILPIINDENDRAQILAFCEGIRKDLSAKGVTAKIDSSDARTPDKMWAAIKKGVPVRLEVGMREMAEGMVTYTRRDLGRDSKQKATVADFLGAIEGVLTQMQSDMLEAARRKLKAMVTDIETLSEMREFFKAEKLGGVKIDYALVQGSAEYDEIQKEFSLTARCLPLADKGQKVIIARAY
jgi:prolyl-tRNA synthetase